MKKGIRKAAVAAMAVALVCSIALAGCGSGSGSGSSSKGQTNTSWTDDSGQTYDFELVEPGKLTIGSDCDYPPFIQLEGSQVTGFEADLMKALCSEMGIECNYLEPQKFDTLITAVSSNTKMDVAVSSFTITDERKEEIDFSDSYFDSNQGVVTLRSSSYSDYGDLAGKAVAAQSGTTGESWAKENIPGVTVTALDSATDCFNALVAGKVEAIVLDLPTAQAQARESFTQCQVIAEIPTGEQYGIVVSKDNPGLTAALDAALAQFRQSGGYQKLYDQYFS